MKVGVIMKSIEFLNFREVIFCIVISFFILIILKSFLFFRKLSLECEYPIKLFDTMLKEFYLMFPKEVIMFRGDIYKRGMFVKITTLHKKIYEGEFIGFNGKDMICIVTKTAIVTNRIRNIKDIILIKK
ncbi:hypothetical protein [uncultured Tyzzerella sp.]|uniref:hypothetical protein n=1 Tax=uncultured Tyzzerella sp. TaxID=2321398 RepID=UPI0029421141|nr:hypothetical protein [uncultured Tyzzerella sp.]